MSGRDTTLRPLIPPERSAITATSIFRTSSSAASCNVAPSAEKKPSKPSLTRPLLVVMLLGIAAVLALYGRGVQQAPVTATE
jgi:hypothetical protein